MTAALLEAAGLSVGSYTSPHLARVNERMVWNGEPISDDDLDELLVAVATVEDLLPDAPSYFEILTAAALRWFDDIAVDAAVVEVGLGGTGDATNVVDAAVAVVTNVSIDHVEYIGPTLEDIAAEKAGIVEPGATLVLGETDPDARAVLPGSRTGFGRRARRRLRGARQPARDRWPCARPVHAARRPTTTCSSRCTARTRPTTPCSRSPRPSRSSGARSIPSSSPTRSRDVQHAGTTRGRRAPAAGPARRREERRRRARAARRARRGVRRLAAHVRRRIDAREGTPRDARGARRASTSRGSCAAAPTARAARIPRRWPTPPTTSASTARVIDVIDDVRDAVNFAIEATPADGQVVVTGSLYVVSPARAFLVP